MKISLDWLRDYVNLPPDLEPQRIADRLTMTTVEVEQVVDLRKPLDHVVVARVLATEPHPNSPHLTIADIDDGGRKVRVVCGGTNVCNGMNVALAVAGANVRDANGKEQIVGPVSIRGVESNGMICSAAELGLAQAFPGDEREILDLSHLPCAPGTALAEAVGYDDVILEIDNKSLTNRPDLWGHHGIARELAALFDLPLAAPPAIGPLPSAGSFEVRIEAPDLCRRYAATRVTGVSASASPPWLKARLAKVGQRSINLLVDLTNYVMFAVGQPLHVFDAREISSSIVVRRARSNERLVLLDETDVDLDMDTLVIANEASPLALAGIMGGSLGVREDTHEIWLEVASFHPIPIRRTARRLGLRTESSTRFEKGIDVERVDLAQQMFLALLRDAQPASRVIQHADAIADRPSAIKIDVPLTFLRRKLGMELSGEEMRRLLERLQFHCTVNDAALHVSVPSWRSTGDVSLPEDIVEEVARLYGYDNLVFTPPVVKLEKPVIQPRQRMERRIREYLAFRAGMREVVSYPWVTAQALDAAAMSDTSTIGLATPPAGDVRLQPSLIPQLLTVVTANLRHQADFRIFELSRVFLLPRTGDGHSQDKEQLPDQPHHVAAAFVGSDPAKLFLEAKAVVESMSRAVQISAISVSNVAYIGWADPTAQLAITSESKTIGSLAIVSSRAKRKVGIRRGDVAMFEIDVDALTPLPSRDNRPKPIPLYPRVNYDISIIVGLTVRWNDASAIASNAHEMIRAVTFVDQYVGPQVPAGRKSLTLRLHLGSDEGTLVREQIDEIARTVMSSLRTQLDAVIREEKQS